MTLRSRSLLITLVCFVRVHFVCAQDYLSDAKQTCEEWENGGEELNEQWQHRVPDILKAFEDRHRQYLNHVSGEAADAFIEAVDSCAAGTELKLWASNRWFLSHPSEMSSEGFGELVQGFAEMDDCSKYARIHHLYRTASSEILKRPDVFYANILKKLIEQAKEECCEEGATLIRLTQVYRLTSLQRFDEAVLRVNSIPLQDGSSYLEDHTIGMHFNANIAAGNYLEAIEWLKLRRQRSVEKDDQVDVVGTLNDIGFCYHRSGSLDSARFYYDAAMKRAKRIDHVIWQGIILGNISAVLKDEGRYEEAIAGLLTDYQHTKESHDFMSGVRALLSVSESYRMLGQLDSALFWLDKAESELGRPGKDGESDAKAQRNIYDLRYDIYKALEDDTRALEALEHYQVLHDSLTELKHRRKTRNLTAVMDAEKLESEKNALQEENVLNKELLREQRENFVTALVFTGGLLIALAFLFFSYRAQKRAQKKTAELLSLTSQQNEKLKNFALIVSHNLRGSAGNISGLITLIEEADSEEERKRFNAMLRESSDKLNKTVGGLRNLIENYAIRGGNEERFTVKPIIVRVVEEVRNNIDHEDLEVQVEVPSDLKMVGIPSYMESIVHNFATNASKYRHPNRAPKLIIHGEERDGEVLLRFSDNGRGMDLDQYGDQLFGLFNTFHEYEDSQGVGLYVTRNQVEGMGGRIEVSSTLGVGTTFTVYLQLED